MKRTPLSRSARLRRTAFRPKRRRPPMDPGLRETVHSRDGGLCQYCAGAVHLEEAEIHHRKLRSQGGPDTPENLITLCTPDHGVVHQHPARSMERGFICPATEDPAAWPVHRFLTTWGQPTATGWELPGGRPDTSGDVA